MVALAPWGSDYFRLVSEHADVFAALPSAMHEGALGLRRRRQPPRPVARRTRRAGRAVARRAGAAGLLPPGRPGLQEHTDEIEPLYPGLDLPVLVVWGTDDTWIPVDRAQRLAAMIPGARLG